MKAEKILKNLHALTGRTRFRSTWQGKLVLEVQYQSPYSPSQWRDARTQDLAELHTLHYSTINVFLPDIDMPTPGEVKPSGTGKSH